MPRTFLVKRTGEIVQSSEIDSDIDLSKSAVYEICVDRDLTEPARGKCNNLVIFMSARVFRNARIIHAL
jgi:hypothetical protein